MNCVATKIHGSEDLGEYISVIEITDVGVSNIPGNDSFNFTIRSFLYLIRVYY